MNSTVRLEVCVDSLESAIAAARGGAHRVELCGNLAVGGTTPSAGLIAMVRDKIPIELHVMIRPRAGDFCYTADEFQTMQRDVLTAKRMGVNGVVLGILEQSGHVDVQRTRALLELAHPLQVTFHRAFDMSPDLDCSLEDVIAAGVDRVLTSGGEQTAEGGITGLAKLVRLARDRVVIMAGSGINKTNVRRIMAQTGVHEVHASLRVPVSSPMLFRNEKVSIGSVPGREYERYVVLEENVRQLLRAAAETHVANQA